MTLELAMMGAVTSINAQNVDMNNCLMSDNKNRNSGGQAMIEFKTNYTPGPLDIMYDWSIYKKYAPRICDILTGIEVVEK